ncbi:unnamed protein product [Euphydryas editha]|uniref:PiggyBac transposable element-derived protein domain-containing protein n=1 Tax=Euphydryas editha TaxID=104508 RepID=A0AAU9TNG5_EUPED|nr:unnamed protein product [Euphydryas editha]
MCATKASNLLRKYLPNKPHKWGYKLLVVCDDRCFAYDFEIYSGMENDPELRYPSEPDLGAKGIQSLGTVNKGRLGKDLKIPSIKDLKKEKVQRGYSEQWVANCDNTDIVTVMWYDNKPVILSSSFVGQEPIEDTARNRKNLMGLTIFLFGVKKDYDEKYPGRKGKTFLSCEKYRVELCLNKYNNCFRSFHQ